ncbi:MAG: hypothetical protein IJX13_08845 [Clostridia bacterium]|nr:hypothetical protein [Clostridia bacterium]
MKKKPTLEEHYEADILTDNAALNHYAQCKDCFFRDKTTVNGKECGWKKGACKIYEYPNFKPDDVMRDRVECEYYEKQKC